MGAHFDPALTLRCPDTDRHRRFYERLGFVAVARLPRYYHGHDFVELDFPPLAGHCGYAARVDGSEWL